jgi:hypothetical protein
MPMAQSFAMRASTEIGIDQLSRRKMLCAKKTPAALIGLPA